MGWTTPSSRTTRKSSYHTWILHSSRRCQDIILPCSVHRTGLLSSSLYPFKKPSTPSWSLFFFFFFLFFFLLHQPQMCVCAFPPPFLLHTSIIHRLKFCFRISAALDMGGTAQAHMVPHHHDALTALLLEGDFEIRRPCAPCVAVEPADRMKEAEGGGLSEDSSSCSFSLPQPAYDLVACPPLNTQAAVWDRRVRLPLVSHSVKLCTEIPHWLYFYCSVSASDYFPRHVQSLLAPDCALHVGNAQLISQSPLMWMAFLNWGKLVCQVWRHQREHDSAV